MPPAVSVVIPVYNGERFLAQALASVRAQDYRGEIEILVVDDGSTDGSAEIARAHAGVRYLLQPNQGNATARNHGIAAASHEFIALLDQDDLWLPSKTTRQIGALLADPALHFASCHCSLRFEPDTDPDPPAYRGLPRTDFPSYVPSGLLARRIAFTSVGLFNPTLRLGSDTDWFFRANDAKIPSVMVPEVLYEKRIHEQNLGAGVPAMKRDLFAVLRASVARKRAAAPPSAPPAT